MTFGVHTFNLDMGSYLHISSKTFLVKAEKQKKVEVPLDLSGA